MDIIDVAPMTKGAGKRPLSYYTAKPVGVGDIVRIPVRNRTVLGLVVKTTPVADAKSVIKTSTFSFKKADSILSGRLYTQQFIEAVVELADWFATDVGSVITALCPSPILEEADAVVKAYPVPATGSKRLAPPKPDEARARPEVLALQSPDDDRIGHYKSLVRESFARGSSVFFCVPTINDVERLSGELRRGIEHAVFALSGALSRKEVVSRWTQALASTKPVVIVATGTFLSLPRADVGVYVVENELSGSFRMQSRPYLDIREAVERIARANGAVTIIAGSLLRINTLWRLQEGHIGEYAAPQFRSLTAAECAVLPMKDLGTKAEGFIFHPEIVQLLRYAHGRNERVFLFNSRRGLAPIVVCRDCGRMVKCEACEAPTSLHGATADAKGAAFICHRCGSRRDALEKCSHCQSWNLVPLGIGTEAVAAEATKFIPGLKPLVLSSDSAKTRLAAKRIADEFYAHPGSVMVGTELALPYLSEPVEHVVAISIDPLLSLPDFIVHERIMHVLLTLRRVATHSSTFQTRADDPRLFHLAATGNLIDYHRAEMNERKELDYPPYSLFIAVSLTGAKDAVAREMAKVRDTLEAAAGDLELSVFPAFVPVVKGKYVLNGLMKLPRDRWVDRRLLEAIRSLPPFVKVVIDAESIM